MKEQYDAIMEERRIAAQKLKEEHELFQRKLLAVLKIQALYRGWKVRKAMMRAQKVRKVS